MHLCLNITEIVWKICVELDGPFPARTKHLLALAQTCRSFRDPALASLWEYIPDLIPLIKCIGRDAWKEHHTGGKLELKFSRPMSRPEVALIKKYARLVRYFGIVPMSQSPNPRLVVPSVWTSLRRALGDDVLFPNVRSIRVTDVHTMKFIQLFSIENLRSFTIDVSSASRRGESYLLAELVNFSSRYPSLKSIGLQGFKRPEQQKAVAAALLNWQNLSRCTMTHVSLESLQALFKSSDSLRFIEAGDFISYKGVAQLSHPGFPVLQGLAIKLPKMADAIQFVDDLPGVGDLNHLCLSFNAGPCREKDWLQLLLSAAKHERTLKELTIHDERFIGPDTYTAIQLSNSLLSALATNFSTLTHVSISNSGGYNIVDEDLRTLTKALPQLVDFSLIDKFPVRKIEFQTTIASLAFFAQNCPHLSSLALGFDARPNKIPKSSGPSLRRLALKTLHVSVSPVGDAKPVAEFLCDIFSDIVELESDQYPQAATDVRLVSYRILWAFVILKFDFVKRHRYLSSRNVSTN